MVLNDFWWTRFQRIGIARALNKEITNFDETIKSRIICTHKVKFIKFVLRESKI